MTDAVTFHDLREAAEIPPALLERTETDLSPYLAGVDPIIAAVRAEGDAALLRFARDYDRVTDAGMALRATEAEFDAAFRAVDSEVVQAIEFAIDAIRRFHEEQRPAPLWLREMRPGVWAGERVVPIDSVACYVPRGKGSFPSMVNMTVVPGVVAGVPHLIVVTPPGADGTVDAGTLVAAKLAGCREVYKCGGAQAVAAVAFGTETVPRCHKIVGPGSPWVVAAKQRLAGVIDPGLPAGPSESIVLADAHANGRLAALDLIVESEHGADSSAWLVTDNLEVAEAARAALPGLWAGMEPSRAAYSRAVLGGAQGGIVVTRDLDAAVAFVNAYAPEHLLLLVADPLAVLGRIRNAGEALLGSSTPLPLGNYLLGPNAVLPTGGHARTCSPLSVHDFTKRMGVGWVTPPGYPLLAKHAHALAVYEGFDGHARAVSPLREELA